ncbi:hypothetical protein ACFQJC_04960 [Haloferax namakaokahaiae]|uniref:Zinc ribbon domain-containing protein n=1 Tax=Haloferax namakaokahaiae TaxID=1748331 RepID=A0ABD5ZCQ5_9EURY
MAEFVCEKCREPIREDAVKCPNCSYEPEKTHRRKSKWYIGIGALISLTFVGAIIGLPLMLVGFIHQRKESKVSPAVEVPE